MVANHVTEDIDPVMKLTLKSWMRWKMAPPSKPGPGSTRRAPTIGAGQTYVTYVITYFLSVMTGNEVVTTGEARLIPACVIQCHARSDSGK